MNVLGTCPYCGAVAGKACVNNRGEPMGKVHPERSSTASKTSPKAAPRLLNKEETAQYKNARKAQAATARPVPVKVPVRPMLRAAKKRAATPPALQQQLNCDVCGQAMKPVPDHSAVYRMMIALDVAQRPSICCCCFQPVPRSRRYSQGYLRRWRRWFEGSLAVDLAKMRNDIAMEKIRRGEL